MWQEVRENINSENLEKLAKIRQELQCTLEAGVQNIGSNFFVKKIAERSLAEDKHAGELIPKDLKDNLFAALQ